MFFVANTERIMASSYDIISTMDLEGMYYPSLKSVLLFLMGMASDELIENFQLA
jgi:hypothetical protein